MRDQLAHFNSGGGEVLRGRNNQAGLLAYAGHILDRLNPPQGANVLDVGCGDGAVLRTIKELRPDLECTGMDFAAEQIAKARSENTGSRDCAFHVVNLLDECAEWGRFDRIYSFSVAQYFSREQLLTISRRLKVALKLGGLLAHLSIPDLRKRALLFDDSFVNIQAPGPLRHWLALARLALVDAKRTLTGDDSYGEEGRFHNAEALAEFCSIDFRATVLRPSDSWYRFDFILVPH